MRKRSTGLAIAVFCLLGIVGVSEQKTLKDPAPLKLILGLGGAAGLVLAFRGRGKSSTESNRPSSAEKAAAPSKPLRPSLFLVKLPKRDHYAVPQVCCSCLGAADTIWPATHRSGSWRYTLDVPFCAKCRKAEYSLWNLREPVSFYLDQTDQVVFGFDNPGFARKFSEMNGGAFSEVKR